MSCVFRLSLSIILIFTTAFYHGQVGVDDFKKYNKKRTGPYTTYWSELLFCSSLALDLDYKTSVPGNINTGMNAGVGVGYMFKIGLDDLAQCIGLGAKAEYYPNAFYKFNIQFDAKILALGSNKLYACVFGGGEFNVTFDIPFERREFHTILYMVDVMYNNFEFKWGLQSWFDKYKNTPYFDYTFSSFRLTYRLRKKPW